MDTKKTSFARYGDLRTQTIKVDYVGTDYTFQIGEKTTIEGLEDLNTQLNNQGDTTSTDYTIDNLPLKFDTTKTIPRAKSIAKYGDLINKKLKISYVGNNFVYQIDDKTEIIGFNNLKSEYKLQKGKTNDWTIEEFTTIFNETKFKEGQLAKANSDAIYTTSIATYGDLTNLTNETLGVSYDGTNFVFRIDTKDPIIGIEVFKAQYDLQSGTENTLTTIDQIETKIGVAKFKNDELTKAKSIKTYGNLLKETIKVNYNGTYYTFQVGSNSLITGLTGLNNELNNQGDTEERYTLNNLSSILHFDQTKSLNEAKKTKNKMISTSRYGDLLNNKIKVDYGTDYTFQIGEKDPITGLAGLNTQLNFQGDTTTTNYTIDTLPLSLKIDETKTVAKAKAKRNLITEINDLWTDELKTAVKKVIGTNALNASSLDTNGDFKADFLSSRTLTQLEAIKRKLKFLKVITLTSHPEKATLIAEISALLTDDSNTLKTAIKKVIDAKAFGNSSLSPNFAVEDFDESGDFKVSFWTDKTISELTTVKRNLENLNAITLTTHAEKVTLIAKINALLTDDSNTLKTAIKKVLDAKAFGNSSLSPNFAIEDFDESGDFKANFWTDKTVSQLTTIKENLQLLNAVSLTSHAEKVTLIAKINALLTDDSNTLKTAIKKVLDAKAFGNSSLSSNFAIEDFDESGNFKANFWTDKTVSQLTTIKENLQLLKAVTLTSHAEKVTLIAKINALLTPLKPAITKAKTNSIDFTSGTLISQASFENDGSFVNDFLNDKTVDQLTTIKTGLEGLANEITEATSIDTYGNLTSLIDGTLGISYNETNFVFQIDTKDPIKGIEAFKKQYNLQSETENTLTTIDQIEREIGVTKFKDDHLKTAKTKKTSIKTYGNLRSSDNTISVSNGDDGAIKYTVKEQKLNFADLKAEAIKQEITTLTDEEALTAADLEGLTSTQLTKAKSIKTYGDLTNLGNVEVTYDEAYKFKHNSKTTLLTLEQFKTELRNQGITTTIDDIDDVVEAIDGLTGTLNTTKADSIKTYGDLTNLGNVEVTYDEAYKFKHNSKTTLLTLEQFKTELRNQGITTTTIDDIDDVVEAIDGLTGTLNTTNADAKKTKLDSIDRYGNLTSEAIKVDYDGTNYTFQIDGKDPITNLANLNIQLNNQGDTEVNYTIDTLPPTLKFDTTKTVARAKTKKTSIKTYGNLTNLNNAIVDYAETDYTFQVGTNSSITGLTNFKRELENQGIAFTKIDNIGVTLTTIDNIDDVDKAIEGLDGTLDATKAKSIKTYGDLRTQVISVSNGDDGTIKYAVKNNQKLNFDQLKTQASNQEITTFEDSVTEATLSKSHLTGLDATQLAKAKSIKTSITKYGNLRSQTINVSNDTNGAIKYTVKSNQKLNFDQLKIQASNQGITLTNEEALTNNSVLNGLVTTELTKAKSIKRYGNLRSETINVSNDTNGAIKYTVKEQELNFVNLKTEATNQGITLAEDKNTEATLTATQLTGLVTTELTKAKSIKRYGNLRNQTINVSNGDDGAIKYTVKKQELNFVNLKTEATNQGITLAENKNTEATLTATQLTGLVTSELTKAKSIKRYGDLRTQVISVSNGDDGAIKYTVKEQELNFVNLKTEATNQGITLAEDKNTEATLTATQLTGLVTSELTTARAEKAKANSITTYGDLRTQVISVSNGDDGVIKYTAKSNQKLNFDQLKTQASNQEITLTNEEALTDNSVLNGLVTTELTKAKSIKRYGNLRSETINVSNDTNGAIKYDVKSNQKLNFDQLKTQASNQGITLTNEEALTDNSFLNGLVTTELTKAKSIKTYGNLRTQPISVSNGDDGTIKYDVKSNQKLNFDQLKTQASNQGITLTNEEALTDNSVLNGLVTTELTKAKSITKYGNLRSQTINVSNDTNEAIKYTVKSNQKLNFDQLKIQASNQGITLTNEEALTNNSVLNGLVTTELTKAKSIKRYGNLRSQTINVSNDTNGAIKYDVKSNQKLNFDQLKTQASNQGITLTNEEALTDNSVLNGLVTTELTKAKSIATYGNLRSETINVSNDTNGAIKYAVKSNQKLNFDQLKTQASNQGITLTNEEALTDNSVLNGLVTTELTKAKSIKTYGNLRTQPISVSNGDDGTIKYDVKSNQKLNFDQLKTQASNQGITLTNEEALTNNSFLNGLVTTELTKAKSIKTYGNLRIQPISVSNGDDGTIKYDVKSNQKLNFDQLKTQASNQGITLAENKNTEATLTATQLTGLVTTELTKAKSIKRYGNLRNQTINVSNGDDGAIKYTVKKQELNFVNLKTEATNQGITLAENKNTEATLTATQLTGLVTSELTKAKSIKRYGNLRTQVISVSNGDDGAIKYTVKEQELNFVNLKTEATNQGITLAEDKNTEATLTATQLTGLVTSELTTARAEKAKANSITTYGDLRTQVISVSNGDDGVIKYTAKSNQKLNFDQLKTQASNQEIILTNEEALTDNSVLNGLVTTELTKAKSIKRYGNLRSETINVSNDTNGAIKYDVKSNQKLNFDQLKTQASNQGITLTNEEALTDNSFLNGLVTTELTKAKSIKTYGNLRTQPISVSNGDDGTIKYDVKSNQKLNFDQLKTQASNQGITLTNEEALTDNSVLNGLVTTELTKAKSITKYGNLRSQTINVSNDTNEAIKYTVKSNQKLNFDQLKIQASNQGITLTNEEALTNNSVLNGLVTTELTKAKSIKRYGNLRSQTINVSNDTNGAIKYAVKSNQKLNFDQLKTQASNQGITLTNEEALTDNSVLNGLVTTELTKAKSIKTSITKYGNLRSQTINVSNDTNEAIKYTVKSNQKLNFDQLKIQASNQGITLTNEEALTNNSVLNGLVTTELTKAKSIKRYGNLRSQTINVSNDTNGAIKYAVKSNQKLNFDQLKTQASNQEIILTNEEALTDNSVLNGLVTTELTKAKSIKRYGNLRSETINVSNDTNGAIKYDVKSNQKLNFDQLKTQASNQGITLTNEEALTDNSFLNGLVTTELTKAKSIKTYGNLRTQPISVSNGDDGTIKYDVKSNQKLNFDQLKTQASNQGITLTNEEALTDNSVLNGLVTTELTKAKSIATYGNLRSQTINVSNDTNEAIKYTVKSNQKLNFDQLKIQASNQGITLTNEEALTNNSVLNGLVTTELTKAKSIKRYGNLRSQTINVSNDTNGAIKYDVKSNQKLNFDQLKTQASNQGITLTNEEALTDNSVLNGLVTTELTKAKSIATYGNLRSQTINVSNDTNGAIKYAVKSNQKLNFDQLKTQASNQEITLTNEEALTDNSVLNGLVTTELTKAKSIKRYGNLISQTINVSNDTNGTIKYAVKSNQKLNFDQLKTQASNQGITLTNENELTDNSVLNGLFTTELTKAKSIATYGNLTSEPIKVDYKTDYTFQVGTNSLITGLTNLNIQLNNQGDTADNYTIDNLPSTLKFDTTKTVARAKSIATYGNLTSEPIKVDYKTDYTFQVGTNSLITGLTNLNIQLNNQGDTADNYTIDNLPSTLKFDTTKTVARAKSIATYGNLTSEPIKVDYKTDYTFQVGTNSLITGLTNLNIQLNNQGDTADNYTIDNLPSTLKFDTTKTVARAKSIATYGNLTSEPIKVDYKTDYTFQVGTNSLITGLTNLNIQLNNQGDTADNYTIDNLPPTLKFDTTKTVARAKSIATYGNLTSEPIKVDYKTDYTFQVGTNSLITGLTNLNIQLNNQGDTADNYTIDNLPSTLKFDTTKTVARAKSIATYGNLTSEPIKVDYKTDYTFQVGTNSLITGLTNLNIQLNNQGDTADNYTIDNLPSTLKFDTTKTVARAKSIATYGNLTSEPIKVDYKTDYTFQVGTNSLITGLTNLNIQLNNQGDTANDYTIDTLPSTLTIDTTKTVARAKSIATYGNLRSQTIKVDYGTDYTFQVGTNSLIIGLTNLNIQLNIQGDTKVNYTIDDLSSTLRIDTTKTVARAKSIATYGNLTSEPIKVDYETDYTFRVGTNSLITGLTNLNIQLNNQGDTADNYTIDTLPSILRIDKTKTVARAKTKKTSIDQYGNLTNLNNAVVDYAETNYTFKVGENSLITNLANFKRELENQGITFTKIDNIGVTLTTINNIDDVVKGIEGLDGILDTARAKSIATYGNLTSETIEVDYVGSNYTFQIGKKTTIEGLEDLNTELNNQGDTTTTDYTIDTLNLTFDEKKTKARAKSIATYGDLTTQAIKVDYGTDYTFQIGEKTTIEGLAKLNTELNNQGDTENDYTIDNLPSSLSFDEIKTKARAKSIATYGDLTDLNNTISVSNGDDGAIEYTVNGQNLDFDDLKAEAIKQGITLTNGKNTEATLDATVLKGLKTKQLKKAQTKKANLKIAKAYFDLTDVKNASFFNNADDETINAISTEINKINNYDSLIQEVKDIVDQKDNVDLKNALDSRLQELKTKKANLEIAKTYFDLTDDKNASFFNNADDETINAISTEINKINNYDSLIQEVKDIVDQKDNVDLKNALDSRLQQLQTKKANLEIAKTYFDLTDDKNASFFNNADDETINAISTEINKINNYDSLIQEVKDIVDQKDNVDLKNALDSRLQELKTKKANLEIAKTYFDLTDDKNASFFNNADDETINAISTEINKINNYDSLIQEVKDIVDQKDNVDLKNALDSRLQELKTKKANLEIAKTYFDLTDDKNASFFNNADDETINAISTEINKINNYDSLIQEVKDIVDQKDNVDLKNALNSRLQELKTKKANLEIAKTYFDLTDDKNASFFNNADDETINAISTEINKINNYDSLIQEVKGIVDQKDNVDLKNALDSRLQELKTKKANLEIAKTYFDLTDDKNASFFNNADDETINAISTEINKINNYDSLIQEVKDIVDQKDNVDLKNALDSRLQELKTKKANLEIAKTYFDLTDDKNASFFNNADDETINAISTEINKINNYDSLIQEVKDIVDQKDNVDLKNALDSRLQELKTKKANLEIAKTYFDLTDDKNASFFNNADDETINAISTEINKINNYDSLIQEVKDIVDQKDNVDLKNALDSRLQELKTKKANLEIAKTYFDLTDDKNASFFNNADDETINAISTEINKINNYDSLIQEVKDIVDQKDNVDLKNALDSRLQQLQTKKANLEIAKTYFDLTDDKNASFFNNADDETINAISTEINKINNYDSLIQEVKDIVDQKDNVDLKNALDSRLQELKTKKANLEIAKTYFDLTDDKNASFFNNADDETINAISTEINKINNYDSLIQEVKDIVDQKDNVDLKNALDSRLQQLQTKKANLEIAKTYFDLTDDKNASFFNNADDETINAISTEINKINNYDSLIQEVKDIVDQKDNVDLKNALDSRLQELKTKKANLEIAKTYFDLTDDKNASFFNNADDETINAISTEINKINNYDSLIQEVKDIVDQKDNVDLKNALDSRLQELKTKKANLEIAKTYFDLTDDKNASFFNNADDETINAISTEINKINNYDSLIQEVKDIVDQKDNVDLKNALDSRLQQLQTKKANLEIAKTYFDLTDDKNASFFNNADDETINAISTEINKINNYDSLIQEVKDIVDQKDNVDLKNALDSRLQELKTKKANLEIAKTYFDLTDDKNASFFNNADDETINAISTEINKINNYDSLIQEVKDIVDQKDNVDLKNALDSRLQELKTKKANLEIAKTYFDLTDDKNASFFNNADDETINAISTEINKINNYDSLIQEVKDIVDQKDNVDLKNALDSRLQQLQTKKANLEIAKTYFDLTDDKNASFFNNADDETINAISTEINKINNYDSLIQEVKDIVDQKDNVDLKNALDSRLQELKTKKANLEIAKTYFDLTDDKNASFFNNADDETINAISTEINKINNYDSLIQEVKDIVDQKDNVDLKNALDSRLQELKTKKANLEIAKTYFDLTDDKNASFFNNADDETINAISTEINKINNYDSLIQEVKDIVDQKDNVDLKNALDSRLQQLQTKKANLEIAKTYFDLTDDKNASFFNNADDETINAISTEINKINNYDSLIQEVKDIVDQKDNVDLKNALDSRLQELKTKKANLEIAKTYFDLTDDKNASFFNNADDETINAISTEINKINNYDSLIQEVKDIVDQKDNVDLKNALDSRLQELKTKKANLEIAKTYFDLTDDKNASFFNNADDETINAISTEINKINNYDSLIQEVKDIVDQKDNVDLKNALDSRLQELKTKKANLEIAKTYFDLTDDKNASFFNNADDETINAISTEINKINNYDTLVQEVKDIVDHNDNSEFKNALKTTLKSLETKKTNLAKAKTYFDLTDVQDHSIFNNADDETINAISTEINKINNYDVLSDDVKAIVDHNDNSEFQNALDSRLQELKTKKVNIVKAKARAKSIATYGDLKTQAIKVDYGTDYTFQIGEKTTIEGLADLNIQLDNQGDTTEDYTIDTLPSTLTIDTTKTLARAKSKKTSIDQYGNLTNLTDGMLGVSYNGTNFVFQIDGKTAITGIDTFKTQYDLQSETENTLTTIDQIKKEIGVAKFKDGELATAKTAKATTSTTSEPGQLQDSESNNLSIILPIVSGVILAIIVIGVLLKKYFKNKKNK